jgi:uncharacterized membrane protein
MPELWGEAAFRVNPGRIRQIDAARGTAMLFVFVSHFGATFFQRNGATVLDKLFEGVGMVATPAFMIISGMMLGYLYHVRQDDFGKIRDKLRDRALFFLLVGHLLIALAHIPTVEEAWRAFAQVFITDTIGFCLLLGPFLIERWNLASRVFAGTCIYLIGWVLGLLWTPGSPVEEVSKSILFSSPRGLRGLFHLGAFPLVPWFGVYLAFTSLGEKIAMYQTEGRTEKTRHLLGTVSSCLVCSALLLAAVPQLLTMAGWRPGFATPIWRTWYPFQKFPPGPAYLLLYGGVGLWIIYALFRFPDRQPWRIYVDYTSLLGQTSFFVFVLQYYVFVLMGCAHLKYDAFWPFYLLGSIVLISSFAYVWHYKGYNRFLTFRWKTVPSGSPDAGTG